MYRITFSMPVTYVATETGIPETYDLSQNYPNPFNPETVITYQLAEQSHVTMNIYNVVGQRIRTLVEETRQAGSYTVRWDGRDNTGKAAASGMYLCRMEAGDYSAVRKMLLVR